MGLYEQIVARKEKIALVGLGYVGMPIAVAFARKADVIGFDLNQEKIKLYKYRKSTRLNTSHNPGSRMPSCA